MQIEAGKTYRDAEGNKVGPLLIWDEDVQHPWSETKGWDNKNIYANDGTNAYGSPPLVAEWVEGPVRTVTRHEVVAGTYGPLEVGAIVNALDCVAVDLSLDASLTADEIDTLIAHLTAIAEALRES